MGYLRVARYNSECRIVPLVDSYFDRAGVVVFKVFEDDDCLLITKRNKKRTKAF